MSAQTEAQLIRCTTCGATNRVAPKKGQPVCGQCKTPLGGPARPVTVTDENFAREVEQSPLPVLVDFWAAWCGPCRMIAPVLEQLADELSGRVRVAKLNIDENKQTAARFRVRSIPTLLVFKDGREVDRIVGALPRQAILDKLKSVI